MSSSKLLSPNPLWEKLCLTTQDAAVMYLDYAVLEADSQIEPDAREESFAECEELALALLEEEPTPEIIERLAVVAGGRFELQRTRRALVGRLLSIPNSKSGHAVFRQLLSDAESAPEAEALLETLLSDDTILWPNEEYRWVAIILALRADRHDLIAQKKAQGLINAAEIVYCAIAEYERSHNALLIKRYLFSAEYRKSNPTRWGGSVFLPSRISSVQLEEVPTLEERDEWIGLLTRIFAEATSEVSLHDAAAFIAACEPREQGKLLRVIDRATSGRLLAAMAKLPEIEALGLIWLLEEWANPSASPSPSPWERQSDQSLQSAKNLLQELPLSETTPPLLQEGEKLELMHRVAFYGCKVPWERFFVQTDAGSLVAKISQLKPKGTDNQKLRETLLARWFEECATREEWDLALPVAAAELCSYMDRWVARASVPALLVFAEASAASERAPMIADLLKHHQEAKTLLPLFAERATQPRLRARAWALAAAFGYPTPPLEDELEFYIRVLLSFESVKRRTPKKAELSVVDALLQRLDWRGTLLAHPSLTQCLTSLASLAKAASRHDLFERTRSLWLLALPSHTELDRMRVFLDDTLPVYELASTLATLPSERSEAILELVPLSVNEKLARSEVANRARVLALGIVTKENSFDPSQYPVESNPALVAEYIAFAVSRAKQQALRRHALRAAIVCVITKPPRAEEPEPQASPEGRIRRSLRELISAHPDAAKEMLEELSRLIVCVQRAIQKSQRPAFEVLAAQIRTLGILRERRAMESLQSLSVTLRQEGVSALENTIKNALDQMNKVAFSRGTEPLIVNMALEALLVVPGRL